MLSSRHARTAGTSVPSTSHTSETYAITPVPAQAPATADTMHRGYGTPPHLVWPYCRTIAPPRERSFTDPTDSSALRVYTSRPSVQGGIPCHGESLLVCSRRCSAPYLRQLRHPGVPAHRQLVAAVDGTILSIMSRFHERRDPERFLSTGHTGLARNHRASTKSAFLRSCSSSFSPAHWAWRSCWPPRSFLSLGSPVWRRPSG